jgi:hypothetical protein
VTYDRWCNIQDVKARSRRLTALVDSFQDAYEVEVGSVQRVCVVDHASKHGKLVAHNDRYTQVCSSSSPSFFSKLQALLICFAAVATS